jgi:hydrogenase maturation factor
MTVRGPLPGSESEPRHCITCGDEGIVMLVMRVDRVRCLATCVKPGGEAWGTEEIAIDLVEPVRRGQTLLVHAGVALANLDQTDAALASLPADEPGPIERSGRGTVRKGRA